MFKFLVLGVFLSQSVVKDCYGQAQSSAYDSQPDIMLQPISPQKNDSRDALKVLHKDGQYHIYASRLNLYLGGTFAAKVPTGFESNHADKKLDADYVVTEGIGAHKLHVRKLPWFKAMKTCIEEGGHLAVIRSDLEEKIILGMMAKTPTDYAWIGYHDLFEEGNWFSVLGEPLAETGWSRWSPEPATNPIYGNGHCGEIKSGKGGLVNKGCSEKRSFICKVSID